MKRYVGFILVIGLLALSLILPVLAQDGGLTAAEIEEIGRTGAVSVGGGIGPQNTLVMQEAMTPNETLVMNWLDASVKPDKAEAAAQDILATNFKFYGAADQPAWGPENFINLDRVFVPTPDNVTMEQCVLKAEHDLVEAQYSMDITFSGQVVSLSRTILFRVEDGKITEAWLGHTLVQ